MNNGLVATPTTCSEPVRQVPVFEWADYGGLCVCERVVCWPSPSFLRSVQGILRALAFAEPCQELLSWVPVCVETNLGLHSCSSNASSHAKSHAWNRPRCSSLIRTSFLATCKGSATDCPSPCADKFLSAFSC